MGGWRERDRRGRREREEGEGGEGGEERWKEKREGEIRGLYVVDYRQLLLFSFAW